MTSAHDHTWQTRSRHRTSEGIVSYERCHCGRWQVRLGSGCVLATGHGRPDLRLVSTQDPEVAPPLARPTTTTEPPWQTVTGPDGAFHVGLPADWQAITVAGGMTGRGGAMFPDDVERADLAEAALTILPTPRTRLLAMDGDSPPYVEETDVLIVESGPASVGQQAAYDLAKQYTDAPILREGTATTPVGVVGWFETSPDVPEMVARKYVVVHDGTGWVVTYWSGDIAARGRLADRIVGSFTPT